jgi:hypothetical protein
VKKYNNTKLQFPYIKRHTNFYFYCYCCIVLFNSCAQVVAPTGGKIDKVPPRVVKYLPDSAALNFNSKGIIIFFNEFVQLKDLNNQLLISPPLEFMPDVKAKNNTVTFDFDKSEKLKSNTTYSINFGNAIQDIHENNAIENFKYVFSTGSFIDSLIVKGKVETAFDHKTEKGVLVMLYKDQSDSVIYKTTPDYFGKTKEDGSFLISNVAEGRYKVMALKDANANYKYDTETESIGFADTLLNVNSNTTINLSTFLQPPKKLFLKTAFHNYYGNILLIFNKPADNILVKPLNPHLDEKDIFIDISKNKDTLNYWFRNVDNDSIIVQVSSNNQVIDTLSFKTVKKAEALKTNRGNPLKFRLVSSPDKNQNLDLNSELQFTFSHPIDPVSIEALKTKEIQLMEDSILYNGYNDLFYQQKGINAFVLRKKTDKGTEPILPVLKENTKYHLLIKPGTFTDIFGFTNDSIQINFKTREEKQYGSLKVKIDIAETEGNYIVQLLDEKENIIRETNISKAETLNYLYLLPKKYKLKVIFDDNKNHKWDTGNLLKKQQPEKVVYNAETITARPNWDLDLEWKVNR